jgi:uncharacterized repeat protein (TIGR02543 family)
MSGSTSAEWPAGSLHPEWVIDGTVLAKPTSDPTRKSGPIFISWCADSGLTTEYDFSQPVTGDLTLYAKWGWAVTWNLNGGEWAEGSLHPDKVAEGAVLTKPTPDPVRDGYDFVGWYSNSGLTTEYDFSKPVTAALTLYAKWGEKVYRTITWNKNSNSATYPELPTQVENNTVLNEPTPRPSGRQGGYVFGAWCTDAAFTTEYDFTQPVTSNLALYDRWDWPVTWNLNGGAWAEDSQPPNQTPSNKPLAKPSEPTKGEYPFVGWYSNSALTTVYDFTKPVTAALALYAKWEQTPTITWNLNGGTWAEGSLHPDQVANGEPLAKPANPTKDGHVFGGWFTDAALTNKYNFTQIAWTDYNTDPGTNGTYSTPKPVTDDITLYAKWYPYTPGGTHYLLFISDIHWDTSNRPIYETWMPKLQTQVPNLDFVGYTGDLGHPSTAGSNGVTFWNNVTELMTVADGDVTSGFIKNDNLFAMGNHEYYSSGGGQLATFSPRTVTHERLFDREEIVKTDDYILFALSPVPGGTGGCEQRYVTETINIVNNYLQTAPTNIPIFIMAHHPIHIYNGGTPNRTTQNADALLGVLQNYPNVIFLWGHNHSVLDPYYDKVHRPGATIQTTTSSIQTLNFTYVSAGGMRDAEYSAKDKSDENVKGKGLVAAVNNGKVTFTYYDVNGEPMTVPGQDPPE